jgi:hypothetical protein
MTHSKESLVTIAALLFSGTGCHARSGRALGGEPPPGDATAKASGGAMSGTTIPVYIVPTDLTTAFGEAEPQVVIGLGGPFADGLLVPLVSQVTLVRWPERTVVPSQIATRQPSGSQLDDTFTRIVVQPLQPLGDRWYALTIQTLPQPFALGDAVAGVHIPKDLAAVARFRVGSAPMPVAVRERPSKTTPDTADILVGFSEPVVLRGDLSALVVGSISPAGGGISCTAEAIPPESPFTEVRFGCAKAIIDELQLSITGNVSSSSMPNTVVMPGTYRTTAGRSIPHHGERYQKFAQPTLD